jgi:hypothetical protein
MVKRQEMQKFGFAWVVSLAASSVCVGELSVRRGLRDETCENARENVLFFSQALLRTNSGFCISLHPFV